MTLLTKIKAKINNDIHLEELLKGSSTAFVFRVLGIICGYVFTLLITRNFGAEAVGFFALSFTVLQIASVIGRLGMDMALLKFVAEYSSQGKWEWIKKVYQKIFKIVIPFSVFISVIVFFLSPYIAKYIFHKEYLYGYFQIASVGIVPFILLSINFETLRALKKIKEYAFLQDIGILLFASIILSVFLLLYKKEEYNIIIISYIISIFIVFIISFYFLLKDSFFGTQHSQSFIHQINYSATKSIYNCATYRDLFSISIPMLLSSSLFFIMQWTDTIMLGIFKAEKDVGIYNVALKLANMTSITLLAINSISAPKFGEFWSKRDINGLKKIAQQSTKLSFWTSLPILLIYWFFPSYILGFFGSEFKVGVTTLIVLTFGQFINAITGSVGYILHMTGKGMVVQNVNFIVTFLNIVLNFLLIPSFGILGAAFASMVSISLGNLLNMFLVKKYYNFYTINI